MKLLLKEQRGAFLGKIKSSTLLILLLSFITVKTQDDYYEPYVAVNEEIWEQDVMTGLSLGDK